MKVSNLLLQASQSIDSEESLRALSSDFQDAILSHPLALLRSGALNQDYSFEDSGPSVSFDIHTLLGSSFSFEFSPRIAEGEVSIDVRLVHMKDGLGEGSREYATMNLGFPCSETFEGGEDESVVDLVSRAIMQAQRYHADLLHEAGLPADTARDFAAKFWHFENTSN